MKTIKTVLWTLFAVIVIALLYFNLLYMKAVIYELQVVKANQAVIFQELRKQSPKMSFYKGDM